MQSDSLPSYKSVVEKLNNLIDFIPSKSQGFVLAANADELRPWIVAAQLTPGDGSGSIDPAKDLKDAADEASAACKGIKTMFNNLRPTLATLDDKRMPAKAGYFVPRFDGLHRDFDNLILGSKELAGKISSYGRKFDEKIIPMCNDKTLTVDDRRIKLNEFLNDAASFDADSKVTRDKFTTLEDNFGTFIDSFKDWAVEMDALVRPKYELWKKQLEDGTAKNPDALRTYLQAIEYEFALHDRMREDLYKLGLTDLKDFSKNGDLMAAFWKGAHNDTLRIQEWLEGGAKDADMPEYMKKSLDQAVHVYTKMADYLDYYAASL